MKKGFQVLKDYLLEKFSDVSNIGFYLSRRFVHMGLDVLLYSIRNYPDLIDEINKLLSMVGFELVYPQLVLTVKWSLIISKQKKKMTNKLTNSYVPKFLPENLTWYERDGLIMWYDQGKCRDFLNDTNKHFFKAKIINFDTIHSGRSFKTLSNY